MNKLGALILQWGHYKVTSGYGFVTVTFPIAFSTAVFSVVKTSIVPSDYRSDARDVSGWTLTTARVGYEAGGCFWMAIGK